MKSVLKCMIIIFLVVLTNIPLKAQNIYLNFKESLKIYPISQVKNLKHDNGNFTLTKTDATILSWPLSNLKYYSYTNTCSSVLEPNENLSTAGKLALNDFTYGNISSSTDHDYYSLSLTNGKFTIDLTDLSDDFDIEFINAAGTVLARSTLGGLSNEKIISEISASGTYFIHVFGYRGVFNSSCYKLTNSFSSCNGRFEPNGSLTSATTFGLNTFLEESISQAADLDYYNITIPEACNITLSLTNLVTDFDIKLLNSSGNLIASSTNGGSANETISNFAVAPGTYYVWVYGYGNANSNNCYRLSNSISYACTGSFEPNDFILNAKTLTLNNNITADMPTAQDHDYYALVLTTAGQLSLNLSTLPADYDIHLMSASGVILAKSENGGTGNESISYSLNTPGTYYVHVFGYNGLFSSKCYTLANSYVPSCDAYEPNETMATALLITSISNTIGQIQNVTDLDYFKLRLLSTEILYMKLLDVSTNYSLSIVNSQGITLAESFYTVSNNSHQIGFQFLAGNDYYLLVKNYQGVINNSCYKLSLNNIKFRLSEDLIKLGKDETLGSNKLMIYPNPASISQNLIVEMNVSDEQIPQVIKIIDVNGKIIFEQRVSTQNKIILIKLEDIAAGMYFLDAGELGTRKVIIE